MKVLSDPIVFYEIRLRGRDNVREPIPPPSMVSPLHEIWVQHDKLLFSGLLVAN